MKATFTLQVNDSGAWRNVVKVTKEEMQEIEKPASDIARIMGNRSKWRILDTALGVVAGYCSAPDFVWTPPKNMSGDEQ
jgi:hypothetical protein